MKAPLGRVLFYFTTHPILKPFITKYKNKFEKSRIIEINTLHL